MEYVIHIIILMLLFYIFSMAFNLCLGYGGLFACCVSAFYGIGAYTSALLCYNLV